MFCPKCGAQIPNGAKFCGGCGYNFQKTQPEQKQALTQPAEKKKKTGLIIGIAAGAVALIAIVAVVLILTLNGSGSNSDVASITFDGTTISAGDTFSKLNGGKYKIFSEDGETIDGYANDFITDDYRNYFTEFVDDKGYCIYLYTSTADFNTPIGDFVVDGISIGYSNSDVTLNAKTKLGGINTTFSGDFSANDIMSALKKDGFEKNDTTNDFSELQNHTYYIRKNESGWIDFIIKVNDDTYYIITSDENMIWGFAMCNSENFTEIESY